MDLGKIFEKLKKKNDHSEDLVQPSKEWFRDRYEWLQVQRNILFVTLLACIVAVVFLTFSITYIKSTRSIEPFVIEIEPKTGVPTVVDPVTSKAYTGEESISRYFIWQYIQAHEEYSRERYNEYLNFIAVTSAPNIFSEYKRANSINNQDSKYNKLGQNGTKRVELKSLVVQTKNTAQARIRATTSGSSSVVEEQIVLVTFNFNNLEMDDKKRLLNPLGFTVTNYKIEDELIK